MERSYAFRCGGDTAFYVTALDILTFLYKFVLQAVGLVLAFHTRSIKVDVLNDYRYNAAIIIASSLLALYLAVVLFFADGLHVLWSGIPLAAVIFLIIALYLVLTFLPKVCNDHGEITITKAS